MSSEVVRVVCDRGEWHIKSRRSGRAGRRPWILGRFVKDGDPEVLGGWRVLPQTAPRGSESDGEYFHRIALTPEVDAIPGDPLSAQGIVLPPCPCGWPSVGIYHGDALVPALEAAAVNGSDVDVNVLVPPTTPPLGEWSTLRPYQAREWETFAMGRSHEAVETAMLPPVRQPLSVHGEAPTGGYLRHAVVVVCDGGPRPAWHRTHGVRVVTWFRAIEEPEDRQRLTILDDGDMSLGLVDGPGATLARDAGMTLARCECGYTPATPSLTMQRALDAAALLLERSRFVVTSDEFAAVVAHL